MNSPITIKMKNRRKKCYENWDNVSNKDTFEEIYEKVFKRKLGEEKI